MNITILLSVVVVVVISGMQLVPVAPDIDCNLHKEQFWATATASGSVWLWHLRSCWMVLSHLSVQQKQLLAQKHLLVTCLGNKPRGSDAGRLCRSRPERRRLRRRLRDPLISILSLAASSSSSSSSESPSKSSSLGGNIRLEKKLGSVGPLRNNCTVRQAMQHPMHCTWFVKF